MAGLGATLQSHVDRALGHIQTDHAVTAIQKIDAQQAYPTSELERGGSLREVQPVDMVENPLSSLLDVQPVKVQFSVPRSRGVEVFLGMPSGRFELR
jgi:hypothetical protein